MPSQMARWMLENLTLFNFYFFMLLLSLRMALWAGWHQNSFSHTVLKPRSSWLICGWEKIKNAVQLHRPKQHHIIEIICIMLILWGRQIQKTLTAKIFIWWIVTVLTPTFPYINYTLNLFSFLLQETIFWVINFLSYKE